MAKISLKVQARLPEIQALWFAQRLVKTKKTQSELLAELIMDRINLELNPWKWIGEQFNKGPTENTPEGYHTLIPIFPKEEQGGAKT